MAGYNQTENNDLQSQQYTITLGDLEGLLDVIADALIQSPLVKTTDVENNQKFIRDGNIKTGQGDGTLALYQKDIEANVEDDLQQIANQIDGEFQILVQSGVDDTISISIAGGGGLVNGTNITNLIFSEGNPLNVSQFIPLVNQNTFVNPDKAEEYLDTNIFELLPASDTRQSRIIRFFQELNALLPPDTPEFDKEGGGSLGNQPDGRVDRLSDGTWTGATQYNQDNSISYAQDNQDGNIDEDDAFIHRLKGTANDTNSSRTIEDIYNRILPYLTDILEEPILPQDDRPVYENKSSGYLKFRNLNQGIIIRNTNQDFIEGLDPNNPTFLDRIDPGISDSIITEGTGFTVTMWVRFLDKASTGTLFNFGNPTRSENPFGFKLETYVLNKDDVARTITEQQNGEEVNVTFGRFIEEFNRKKELGLDVGPGYDTRIFKTTDAARFVRLQVREFDERTSQFGTDVGLRDSNVGVAGDIRFDDGNDIEWTSGTYIGSGRKTTNPGEIADVLTGSVGADENRLLQSTYIPEDFNEWYFICATYNPRINEDESIELMGDNTYKYLSYTPDFWLNHVNPFTGDFEANSGYGNKCKVEIISRTDLLRARGFKV